MIDAPIWREVHAEHADRLAELGIGPWWTDPPDDPPPDTEENVTVREAAERLGIPSTTVARWARAHVITKIGTGPKGLGLYALPEVAAVAEVEGAHA